jgi:mono/diheme cytochrome c family protein
MKSCIVRGPAYALLLMSAIFLSTGLGQEKPSSASKQRAKVDSVYEEIARAPEKARGKRNPLEKDPEAAVAGRILYEQRCAECHGGAAEGNKKGPSLRAAEVQNAEPGAIFWILTNGVVRKGMPVWSKLPEPQRWQLVSYIKSLGAAPAKTETSAPAAWPPPAAKDAALPRR